MKRVRYSELCPLHHSYTCACHGACRFRGRFQVAVEIVEDPHHRRGYREVCSARELRRRKHIMLERHPFCFYCDKKFTEYSEVELIHKEPKGMGGAFHDDHWDNIALGHARCNFLNGSKHSPPEAA